MDPDAELRLVAGLRRGDESAFRPIYEAYSAAVFTFILRMVNRRAIAEELSQEVWMRLAARARSLRDGTRLEPWLFTVARNLCVSYWRTRGVEGVHDGDQDILEAVKAAGTPPDRAAESRELRARLERALASLPRPYREALLLVGVHGLTPAAAASVCGLSPEAMRKRLERARDMLADRMNVQPGARDPLVDRALRREPVSPAPTSP
jgi:RNA polymerase sigma-70 factor (ECF subfamily)